MKVSIFLRSPYADSDKLGDRQLGEWNFGILVPEVGDRLDLTMDDDRIVCMVESRTFHAHESDADDREDRTLRSVSMIVTETHESRTTRLEALKKSLKKGKRA